MLALLIVTVVFKAVKAKEKKLFKVLSVVVAFCVFGLLTFLNIQVSNSKNNYSGYLKVYGRVSEDSYTSKNEKVVVTLDHCYLIDDNDEYFKVSGKVMLYLTCEDGRILDFPLGSTILVSASVSKPKTKINDTYFYYQTKNVRLVGYGSEAYAKFIGNDDRNFIQKYKLKVKNTLDSWLDDDYGELAYTMLFGDRGELDDDINEIFKASGIAHLLAVSGLHVGFIVTLLSFILKMCKANDKVKFVIISVVVFIYAMMCGFTISVTRALIMTVTMLFLTVRRKEYDSLSSLSLACVIVLLMNPFQFYSAGFRLSFGAVLGIVLLARPFERVFRRGLGERLSSALSVSLSAQIGTIPTLALCFRNCSVFSIVANMLAIPIASIAFMIMFSFAIFGTIFKPFGFGLIFFEWIMKCVTIIGKIFGSVTLAGANRTGVLIFSFLLISWGIISSDFMFGNKKPKRILSLVLFALAISSFALSFVL